MSTETVSASALLEGDVVRVDGEDDWYAVGSAFQEGSGGPIDLDLRRVGDQLFYNWHVGPDHQIERRI